MKILRDRHVVVTDGEELKGTRLQ